MPAIWKKLWPAMRVFLFGPVEGGDGYHFTAGSRHAIKAVLKILCEHDESIRTPCSATGNRCIGEDLHGRRTGAKIGRHPLHLLAGEKSYKTAIRRPEWLK